VPVPPASTLLAFVGASVVLALIPGPSLLFTLGRAISSGRREALLTVAGNGLGVFTQSVGVAAGLGPVVAASATAYTVLKVAGALYLVWLGIGALRHRRALIAELRDDVDLAARTPAIHALRRGFVVGLTNPKTIVFFGALLPQFVDRSAGPAWVQMVVLGAIFVAIAMSSDASVALLAGRARDWFASSPRRMERVGGAGGLMMVGLGVGLLFTGRPES